MEPLLGDMPLIGALSVFFLKKPVSSGPSDSVLLWSLWLLVAPAKCGFFFLTPTVSEFPHGVQKIFKWNLKFLEKRHIVAINTLVGTSCLWSLSLHSFCLTAVFLPVPQQTLSFKLGLDCSGSVTFIMSYFKMIVYSAEGEWLFPSPPSSICGDEIEMW